MNDKNATCRYLASCAAAPTFGLLDKVLITAAERAIDPSLLTPSVIESMMQA